MKKLPALKTTLAIALGIVLTHTINVSWIALLYILGGILISGILLSRIQTKTYGQIILILGLILLGSIRYKQSQEYPHNHIIHFVGKNQLLKVKGFLVKDPVHKINRTEYTIQAHNIYTGIDSFNVKGNILITSKDTCLNLNYGDEISCHGYLKLPKGKRNPGGFDYRNYLLQRDIAGIFKLHPFSNVKKTGHKKGIPFYRNLIYPLRAHVRNLLLKGTGQNEDDLLCALILGEKAGLSPEIKETFSKAGIAHLLAVSGLHVGFVLLIFSACLGFLRFPETMKVILTALALLFYMIFTESNPPVVRATVMAITYLFGTLMGKRPNPLNLLGTAGLIMLLAKPSSLFEPGFQLSFSAVLSILLISKPLSKIKWIQYLQMLLSKISTGQGIFYILLMSLSVQIGTLPILISYFNRISLLSFLLNLIAIPLTGLIVALGFTTIFLGSIHPFLAEVYGGCNSLFLKLLIQSSEWITHLKWISIHIATPSWTVILIYYSTLILFLNWGSLLKRKYLITGCLISLNLFIWHEVFTCEARNLTYVQLDVGQGDAAVIHLPGGKTILIDGGPCNENLDAGERIIAPYLWKKGVHKLDAVILTHPHNDHVGGLNYIIEEFRIRKIWTAATPYKSELYTKFNRLITRKNIPVDIMTAPATIQAFPGIKIELLSPAELRKSTAGNLNNQSLVIQIRFGNASILSTGDAEKEAEFDLMKNGSVPVSQILKIGHHGSNTSSSPDFLNSVQPELAIISVGENNRFGLPSKKTLESLETLNISYLRTDKDKAIVLKSTGGQSFKVVKWQ